MTTSPQCSETICSAPATLQTYSLNWTADDPWNAEGFLAYCAGHAPAGSWPLVASDPAPITEEIRMTQNQIEPGQFTKPTVTQDAARSLPGVAQALDHLEHEQSNLMDVVRDLMGRLEPVLQPEETAPGTPMGVDVDGRPRSEIARVIEDHADRLAAFARYVRSVSVRIDV